MNPIFNNSLNPLREHMVQQETTRRQTSLVWICFAFFLGTLLCYIVMRSQTSPGIKEDKT